jgi:outer membrane protein assembly factor BamB
MRLRGLSVTSGIPTFETELPFSEKMRLEPVEGKLIVASDSGYLASFTAGSQKADWQAAIAGIDVSDIVFAPGKMIATETDKTIRVISLADGKTLASSPVENSVSALNVFDGNIVAGDTRGNLTRYDGDYRTVYWRFRNGGRISSIVPTSRGILAASLDNFVYMVSGYYGDIRWKKRMAGRVLSIVPYGELAIVLTVGEPNAVFLNLENGKSAGELSIPDDDSFIKPAMVAEDKLLFFTTGQILSESAQTCSLK